MILFIAVVISLEQRPELFSEGGRGISIEFRPSSKLIAVLALATETEKKIVRVM
jgi:hypothetical protein